MTLIGINVSNEHWLFKENVKRNVELDFKVYPKGLVTGLCNCGPPAGVPGLDIDYSQSNTCIWDFPTGVRNEIKWFTVMT